MSFSDAKAMYSDYVQTNPDTSIKGQIRDEINLLNRKADLQSRWDEIRTNCANTQVDLYQRMKELKEYMDRDSTGLFKQESAALMKNLKDEERMGKVRAAQLLQEKQEQDRQARLQAERDRVTREREKTHLAEAKKSEREKKISDESSRLSKIFSAGGRFKANSDRTVTDSRTGLMWTQVVSYVSEGECMDFDQARQYVRTLNTGGYRDWRLPDASELAVIYNSKPYFPSSGAKWYWTPKITTESWSSGDRAVIFYPNKKDEFVQVTKDQSECGYVHAVRP
jgi:hypothetical protein